MNETAVQNDSGSESTAKIIYILYLVSILVGVTGIVGVVMAYIYKAEAPDWLQSHYQYQIRTFWISLLYVIISFLLTLVVIGFVLLFLVLIWWIVRCVKGLNALNNKQAIPDPKTWMF